jgi:hypothetical protein
VFVSTAGRAHMIRTAGTGTGTGTHAQRTGTGAGTGTGTGTRDTSRIFSRSSRRLWRTARELAPIYISVSSKVVGSTVVRQQPRGGCRAQPRVRAARELEVVLLYSNGHTYLRHTHTSSRRLWRANSLRARVAHTLGLVPDYFYYACIMGGMHACRRHQRANIYMCMYKCICTHVRMHACMYVCMQACIVWRCACMYWRERRHQKVPRTFSTYYFTTCYFTRHTVCMYYWRYVVVLEVGMQVCIGGSGGTRKCLQI